MSRDTGKGEAGASTFRRLDVSWSTEETEVALSDRLRFSSELAKGKGLGRGLEQAIWSVDMKSGLAKRKMVSMTAKAEGALVLARRPSSWHQYCGGEASAGAIAMCCCARNAGGSRASDVGRARLQ